MSLLERHISQDKHRKSQDEHEKNQNKHRKNQNKIVNIIKNHVKMNFILTYLDLRKIKLSIQ